MRRFLIWTGGLTLLLLCLLTFIRFISSANLPSSKVLDYYQCSPQPCWNGIQPGKTSLREAQSIIESKTSFTLTRKDAYQTCWSDPLAAVDQICFRDNGKEIFYVDPASPFRSGRLLLGDAVRLFGNPIGVNYCLTFTYADHLPYMIITWQFKAGIEANGYAWAHGHEAIMTPYIVPDYLLYKPPDKTFVTPWQGFGRVRTTNPCPS